MTSPALCALINGTLNGSSAWQLMPRASAANPRLYGLSGLELNAYDELFKYAPCTNDSSKALHDQLEETYVYAVGVHAKMLAYVNAMLTGSNHLTRFAAWSEDTPHHFDRAADLPWWKSVLHTFQEYLTLLRTFINSIHEHGMLQALGWLMRACPTSFWDKLWCILLQKRVAVDAAFLDLICDPKLMRHALIESKAQRDACLDGFTRWYTKDACLVGDSVQRALDSAGVFLTPRLSALGPDTRSWIMQNYQRHRAAGVEHWYKINEDNNHHADGGAYLRLENATTSMGLSFAPRFDVGLH